MTSLSLELKLGLKVIHTVEGLVKGMRNTGPFGGASIESVSFSAILKKANEIAEYQMKKVGQKAEASGISHQFKVYFEDKFEKSKRKLIELFKVELMKIPEDLNGFEYLCHPHLEKEEHLIAYFNAWHSTTLASLYYLIQNSPVSTYFLTPITPEEQEVSSQLRLRYNLIVETEEAEADKSPKEDDNPNLSKLDLLLSTRHDIKRCLIKMKTYQMKDYSQIIQELEVMKREILLTPHPGDQIKIKNRARFFSDELPEQAIIKRRQRLKEPEQNAYKYSMDTSSNPNNVSLDLICSYQTNAARPFKLQECLIEEKAIQSRRRMSLALSQQDSSLTNMYRKSKTLLTIDSQYNLDDLDYTLTEVPDTNSNEESKAQNEKGDQSRRLRREGLANIGSQLLRDNNLGEELMDMDEDDRIVEISNSLECAQMTIKATTRVLGAKEKPKAGSAFAPTRFIYNLSDQNNKPIEEYLNLNEWIIAQKTSLQAASQTKV
jgi:hypothetical protein